MEFSASNRAESDFQKIVTPTIYYSVEKMNASFYNNKIFDFSSFNFLGVLKFIFYDSTLISTTAFTNFQLDPTYGLYSFTISQSMKLLSTDVILLSFDGTLAQVGGYVTQVWLIIYIFIGRF